MSRPIVGPDRSPLIRYVDKANRALQTDMVSQAHRSGYGEITYAHNAVFSTLQQEGSRASDMAAVAGITRQSMGEIVRGMVELGIVEMRPDPADGRAKLVVYTPRGLAMAREGFQHIIDLEQRFVDEFGEDYEVARQVLDRVVTMLTEPGPE